MKKVFDENNIPKDLGTTRWVCPDCYKNGYNKESLALTLDHRGAVWICHRCEFKGSKNNSNEVHIRHIKTSNHTLENKTFIGSSAERLWKKTIPVRNTVGETYLTSFRRCSLPPKRSHLRFIEDCYHPLTKQNYPALVGLITDAQDQNRKLNIQVIYLKRDGSGKADVPMQKRYYKGLSIKGGVIRIFPDEYITDTITIAEGIETSLTACYGYGVVWCGLDAGNLSNIKPIEKIKFLNIVADNDDHQKGINKATEMADNWFSNERDVHIIRSKIGNDLNDIVNQNSEVTA